jgi:peroxiredoxin Q/BCP
LGLNRKLGTTFTHECASCHNRRVPQNRHAWAAPALLLLAATLFALGCGPARRPDGGVGLLPVGAAAPEVVGYDAAGKDVRLSALTAAHTKAVVYFYPKDESPGCTTEACAFRDAWDRYIKAGVSVIGVSSDSRESHTEFLQKKHLPFALASDEDGTVGATYGVPKRLWGYSRVTFLVGADGKIVHVWPDVDPGIHADEVLQAAGAP